MFSEARAVLEVDRGGDAALKERENVLPGEANPAFPLRASHFQIRNQAEHHGAEVCSEERARKEPARPDRVQDAVKPPHLLDFKEVESRVVVAIHGEDDLAVNAAQGRLREMRAEAREETREVEGFDLAAARGPAR